MMHPPSQPPLHAAGHGTFTSTGASPGASTGASGPPSPVPPLLLVVPLLDPVPLDDDAAPLLDALAPPSTSPASVGVA